MCGQGTVGFGNAQVAGFVPYILVLVYHTHLGKGGEVDVEI